MLSTFLLQTSRLATIAAAIALIAPIAAAQTDDDDGAISQEGVVNLTFDHGSDPKADYLSVNAVYSLGVRLGDGWTAHTDVVVDTVGDPVGISSFKEVDARIETLSINYAGDWFSVYAGKIDPVFGSAFGLAPGLYGVEVGQTYQLVEKNGVGGDVSLTSLMGLPGEQVVSVAVFTADRSILSGALDGRRERLRLEDGGPSNTRALKSYTVSLDGTFDNGFGYTVGYRNLAGAPGEADETMGVAGVSYTAPDDADLPLNWIVEAGQARNLNGVADAERTYYTAGAVLDLGDWFVSATASGWKENAAAGDLDLRKVEASIGREIADGLTLEVGAEDMRQAGDSQTILGVRLSWEFG